MNRQKIQLIGAAAVLVVGALFVGKSLGGSSSSAKKSLLIVPRPVERRTLEDVLNVSGEVRRDETTKINSPVDGQVSEVNKKDGETVNVGDSIFSLNGRSSVAVEGKFAFYRSLDVGDVGPDVRQLESVLVKAGTGLSQADDLYTEETRAALQKWQRLHNYPAAEPSAEKTITVSLGQNQAGYTVGKVNSIGYIITPSAGASSQAVASTPAVRASSMPVVHAAAACTGTPVITISKSANSVAEGGSVTFTVTSSCDVTEDLTINLNVTGSATGGFSAQRNADYPTINNSVTIASGTHSVAITREIFTDSVIEDDEDIQVAIQQQTFGGSSDAYTLGSTSSARVVIPANGSDLTRTLSIEASSDTVSEGRQVTFTVRSSVKSNQALDFYVRTSGRAVEGVDYVKINQDNLQIGANNYSATFTVDIKADNLVEPDEAFTVTLIADPNFAPSDQPYVIGAKGAASVTIKSGDVPELHLVGGGKVKKGASTTFRIIADAPASEDTSVVYQLSGSAQEGRDYDVLSGVALLRKGTTSVTITITTLNNGVIFEPSDMLVANWPSRIGTVDVKAGEFVLQGKTLFNLTEPAFTVVMTVSPTDRAKLRVGQAAKVNFNAGESILDGQISQLDDSPTIDEQGNATYEGKVSVQTDLASVDGAKVSIDVTLERRENVIAVPVAAVLRASDGDEVRTVNDKGTITRVKVTIGLVDGEWAEITTGLTGSELVVIDVDPASSSANVTQNT